MVAHEDGDIPMAEPSHSDLHRQIGRLEGLVDAMQHEMHGVKETMGIMSADIKAMRSQLDQGKGGRAALFAALTGAGIAGALATQAIHWFGG